MFKNSLIYIDEFNGFTPQELEVFEKLLFSAKAITISICTNDLEIKNKENDIFYFNKKFVNKILDISNKYNIKTEIIKIDENKKFKTEEMKLIEENFSNTKISKFENVPENVELFLADNPSSELDYVACKILDFVKQGYRFNQIAIVTSNLEKYSVDAKIIFEKYNIPLYLDIKKQLTQNILVKYLMDVLDIFCNNWSLESVMNYIKTGLLDLKNEEIYQFENYCNKWGITRKKFLKEFVYEQANKNQEEIEEIRKKIITPLNNFYNKINGNKNVKTITINLYEYIIENNILNNLNNKLKQINDLELTNEYSTGYKLLIEVLEYLIKLFGDEYISFDKYKELLQIGLSTIRGWNYSGNSRSSYIRTNR